MQTSYVQNPVCRGASLQRLNDGRRRDLRFGRLRLLYRGLGLNLLFLGGGLVFELAVTSRPSTASPTLLPLCSLEMVNATTSWLSILAFRPASRTRRARARARRGWQTVYGPTSSWSTAASLTPPLTKDARAERAEKEGKKRKGSGDKQQAKAPVRNCSRALSPCQGRIETAPFFFFSLFLHSQKLMECFLVVIVSIVVCVFYYYIYGRYV